MKPAWSIILFTTIGGAAQGMAVVAAVTTLSGAAPQGLVAQMLWTSLAMLVAALVASFFHLGHPLRAWRAILMWRTSWMSREVIVLPAYIVLIGAWALLAGTAQVDGNVARVLAVLAIGGAALLWVCTAMIYACIRFIQEWAHPLTIVNYFALGLASGAVSSGALAMLAGETAFAASLAGWALAATALLNARQLQSDYLPDDALLCEQLAGALLARHKTREGLSLLRNLHQRFPDYPHIPRAYLLAARGFAEGLGQLEPARQLLGFIRQRYPASPLLGEVASLEAIIAKLAAVPSL